MYQQTQRWLKAGVFEAIVHDLRAVLRLAAGRNAHPSAASFDSRTLQSSPESGERAGYDGAKRRKGSTTHMAVDTLGHLLARYVTAADEQDRAQVAQLAQAVQGIRLEVSSCLTTSRVLCSCRGGGLSNVPSVGQRVFVGWHATMNACLRP